MIRTLLTIFTVVLLLFKSANSQLSPGDLHQAHANLEGLKNCESCHEAGRKISSNKCLGCHAALKERIDSGKSLHSRADHNDCVVCHVEHLGRDSDLIAWSPSQEQLDHSVTGYILSGKHAQIKCRQCHDMKNIMDRDNLTAGKANLNKTFLGLSQKCASCHRDEHRGQYAADCINCHNTTVWKPAPLFDHNTAKFKLTGRHNQVECQKCHLPIADEIYPDDKSYLKFVNLKYETCNNCHSDVHKGKFGTVCETCHNTSEWKDVKQVNFDHSKTHFPLLGKHSKLACEKCHLPGKSVAGLRYEKCLDCHTDYHQGDFIHRASKGECQECHAVNGFSPSLFTLELHQKGKYQLDGSHLAIPCIACHAKYTTDSGIESARFSFQSTKCNSCHNDPHKGKVRQYVEKTGCETCHNVISWSRIQYDHSQTKFILEGKHFTNSCRSCHRSQDLKINPDSLQFSGSGKDCQDCHKDIHRGQFRSASSETKGAEKTECGRCHTSNNWFPEKFVHNRDAKFKLEGAHQSTKCDGCHKKIREQDNTFTWFKPIETACKSCHDPKMLEKSGEL